jgi:hypothetical protein
MEPLVQLLTCPNCSEATIAFNGERGAGCEACGFDTVVFTSKRAAFDRFEVFNADADVIATAPVRLGNDRWVVAYTRMLLA